MSKYMERATYEVKRSDEGRENDTTVHAEPRGNDRILGDFEIPEDKHRKQDTANNQHGDH